MLTIELPANEAESLEELLSELPSLVTIARRKRFDGMQDLVQALVVLTPVSLPFVAKMIIEKIKSRRHIVVKYKGVELRGLTDSTVLKVLKELQDSDEQSRLDSGPSDGLPTGPV